MAESCIAACQWIRLTMNCPPLSLVHTSKYSSIIPAQFRGFVDRQFRSICKSIYSPSHAIRLLCVLPRLALPQQLVHTLWPFSEQKTWPDVVGEVLVEKGWTPKKTKDAGWPGGGRPSKLGWQACCLGTWSACQPASLLPGHLVHHEECGDIGGVQQAGSEAREDQRGTFLGHNYWQGCRFITPKNWFWQMANFNIPVYLSY